MGKVLPSQRLLKQFEGTTGIRGYESTCDKTRNGKFIVLRQTMRKRLQSKLREIKIELKRHGRVDGCTIRLPWCINTGKSLIPLTLRFWLKNVTC